MTRHTPTAMELNVAHHFKRVQELEALNAELVKTLEEISGSDLHIRALALAAIAIAKEAGS